MNAVLEPSLLSEATVGRKKSTTSEPKRNRARDRGDVTPIGFELDSELHRVFEECRAVKKWSKRTLLEEALKSYFTAAGLWPPPGDG